MWDKWAPWGIQGCVLGVFTATRYKIMIEVGCVKKRRSKNCQYICRLKRQEKSVVKKNQQIVTGLQLQRGTLLWLPVMLCIIWDSSMCYMLAFWHQIQMMDERKLHKRWLFLVDLGMALMRPQFLRREHVPKIWGIVNGIQEDNAGDPSAQPIQSTLTPVLVEQVLKLCIWVSYWTVFIFLGSRQQQQGDILSGTKKLLFEPLSESRGQIHCTLCNLEQRQKSSHTRTLFRFKALWVLL